MPFTFIRSQEFEQICPAFIGACLEAFAKDSPTPPSLTAEINAAADDLKAHYDATTIKQRSGIAATRNAYKRAGKDPGRYRPACEQLARRVLTGRDLYTVSTLVDIGNLVSLRSGYSTAVLDASQIVGEGISISLGRSEEPYEAIGRGQLNIANLPVYRDERGAFATPTSDSTRTMITPTTAHILLLINGYDGDNAAVSEAAMLAERLLCSYAAAQVVGITNY